MVISTIAFSNILYRPLLDFWNGSLALIYWLLKVFLFACGVYAFNIVVTKLWFNTVVSAYPQNPQCSATRKVWLYPNFDSNFRVSSVAAPVMLTCGALFQCWINSEGLILETDLWLGSRIDRQTEKRLATIRRFNWIFEIYESSVQTFWSLLLFFSLLRASMSTDKDQRLIN